MKYLGNTNNIIDWQEVVDDLANKDPEYVGPRHKEGDPIEGLDEVTNQWRSAGLKTISEGGTVGWDMLFPGKQFNNDIVNKFSKFLSAEVMAAWISRVHPGYHAAWHWDANDNETELRKLDNLVRVTCFITKPKIGHVSIIEDKCFYGEEQGNAWAWPDRTSWHAGTNCGLEPKYTFQYLGKLK